LFWLGELTAARVHLEQGIALYNPRQHHTYTVRYGEDPGVVCLMYAALALWEPSYPDQALSKIELALAQKLAHPLVWRLPSCSLPAFISSAARHESPNRRPRK
jgi:hypothetical protein